ncbi:MAG: hypothetical protein AB1330_02540 [Bacillota bacterium]
MRRKTFLFLMLFILLTGMGVGLAWWTDTLTIAGTVHTAKDCMEFTHYTLSTDPYITGDVSLVDRKTLAVSVSGLYPSGTAAATKGRARLHVTMTNTGDVPEKFVSAALQFSPEASPLLNYLKSSCYLKYDEDGPGPKPTESWGYLQYPWSRFDQLDDALNASTTLKGLVLDPGGWISFDTEDENSIVLRLDESAPNETENQTLDFTLQLNFVQWNAP